MTNPLLQSIDQQLKMIATTRLLLMEMLARKGKSNEHVQILQETIEVDKRVEQQLLDERGRLQQKTTRTWGYSGLKEVATDNAAKV